MRSRLFQDYLGQVLSRNGDRLWLQRISPNTAPVAKLADAGDLKSPAHKAWGFDSLSGHHLKGLR